MRTVLYTLAQDFRRDRGGVFALWVGAMAIPLMLLAGAGLDLMRAVNLRAQLQAAVDSAALAGATAYTSSSTSSTATTVAQNYMIGAIAEAKGKPAPAPAAHATVVPETADAT